MTDSTGSVTPAPEPANTTAPNELELFRLTDQVHQRLGALLERERVLEQFTLLLFELIPCQCVIALMLDREGVVLEYGASHPALTDISRQTQLEMLLINIFNTAGDAVLQQIKQRQAVTVTAAELTGSHLEEFVSLLDAAVIQFLPVVSRGELLGVTLIQYAEGQASPPPSRYLPALIDSAALHISNARQHSQIVQELATTVYEMNILQQIDAELNDTIDLNYVFRMIMDWGLRFTSASSAALSLYNQNADSLRVMAVYGYEADAFTVGIPLEKHQGGITIRVARDGEPEVVPDVNMDKDYYPAARTTRSQLSVPIFREEQVIGVLTLESTKLNGFTENHLNFAKSLAGRAGVAVDNARLFAETNREKEKLSLILRNISDIVIVVDTDGRIIVLNHPAAMALRLPVDKDFTGERFADTVSGDAALLTLYQQAKAGTETTIATEIRLVNERDYHLTLNRHRELGWIIVLQDITSFKETDKLKTELVATVSHDLKQPLSVMRGYLDLLQMTNQFDERSSRYMDSLDHAFYAMRQLIDDLLNMAHIESGLELSLIPVNLYPLVQRAVETMKHQVQTKALKLSVEVPSDLPPVRGDESRLAQVFNNLIGNAVKYTQPEGQVKIYTKQEAGKLIIYIEDNGLGISPEDQAQVFERFFRVRRPETESIEGTGLGLAIVKSLVQAHHGSLELESAIGKGSTFSVSLPLHQPEKTVSSPVEQPTGTSNQNGRDSTSSV